MECLQGVANYADMEVEVQSTKLERILPPISCKDKYGEEEWLGLSIFPNGVVAPHFELSPGTDYLHKVPCGFNPFCRGDKDDNDMLLCNACMYKYNQLCVNGNKNCGCQGIEACLQKM